MNLAMGCNIFRPTHTVGKPVQLRSTIIINDDISKLQLGQIINTSRKVFIKYTKQKSKHQVDFFLHNYYCSKRI